MRSHGQVRFITITTRMQMAAASLALVALLGWGGSMGAMAISQYRASSERADLLDREAQVANAETRLDAYRDDLEATTADLEKRQDFLDGILAMLPEDLLNDSEDEANTVSDSAEEAEELIGLIESAIPEAAGLARLEARQLAFVESLTRYADRRAKRTEEAIRSLGLDPRMVMVADNEALGGPLEMLASDADGSLDPRFERLALSLSRMSSLERGLSEIPQVMPADMRTISSGFGYRRDPFNGRAAMHRGLDFRGPHGAPILAAADGRVSFVGNKSGYGRVVEITHGNGMMTRYAHMSAWDAQVGQHVDAGDQIGRIGSTGRSTGPHLHFEVHINGRAVNPRPFLETAPDVLEEARAEFTPTDGATHGE
ncbi:M23 family metallopeptidase [Alteraurantiacibacter aquimixticola]|uniref:M23 family metallopeptidase n=1 Tax=Alteraurantiacibacter aquimixticola TaxID=2489173 RepID=A0A4T3EXI1_9SPHN|nr:M23 family metallopeptidase [Alteraurantiacibacter aquimixticola]TIX49178.1 M23 family metallopeptidase [Alteraurantiacibacter aquimixticola]